MSERSKHPSSYRLSPRTKGQLEELARRWGLNRSEVLALLIDRAHREETRRATVKTVTVRTINELWEAQEAAGLTPSPTPGLPCEVTFPRTREVIRFEWPLRWSREAGDVAAGDDWENMETLAEYLEGTRLDEYSITNDAVYASDDAMIAARVALEEDARREHRRWVEGGFPSEDELRDARS